MNKKIKIAMCVRVAMVLISPGLYYLLSNTLIISPNDDAQTTDDPFTSRKLLSVKDQTARDSSPIESTGGVNQTTGGLVKRPANLYLMPSELSQGEKLRNTGRTVFHVLVSCYCFLMLAIICDEYFIGSIEILCSHLNMKSDFIGPFMTIATSFPELFVSCLGTFVTEGDIGVGTIVGSAVFNILAVPALCGLFTRTAVQLESRLVRRDCIFYGLSIFAFIAVIYDNHIMWYEAALLIAFYAVYLACMCSHDSISKKATLFASTIRRRLRRQPYREVEELTPLFIHVNISDVESATTLELSEPYMKMEREHFTTNPWRLPDDSNKVYFFIRWPITFLLWCTIPDSKRFKGLYILTFINCVLWIGCISYFVVYISTSVETVMGLTFLAAGTSVPEAVSSVIVTAQGFGTMGISNSIGSNTFDILLCLGLPWLIKTLILPTISGQPWITLRSTGIAYSAISLLTTLFALYFSLAFNRFKLDRKLGFICLTFYLLFLVFAWLVELNVFLYLNPTICDK